MNDRNSEYIDMTIALTLILCAFAALAIGCTGSSSSTPQDPSEPLPCYSANEPGNDSFLTTELIVSEAERFLLEGYIHHGDLDCMIVVPYTPVAGRSAYVSFDYAFGWDMEVSIGYRTAGGGMFSIWGAYDSFGQGNLTETIEIPAEAVDLTFSIGQRTLNAPPDSTRYTIEVEIF